MLEMNNCMLDILKHIPCFKKEKITASYKSRGPGEKGKDRDRDRGREREGERERKEGIYILRYVVIVILECQLDWFEGCLGY